MRVLAPLSLRPIHRNLIWAPARVSRTSPCFLASHSLLIATAPYFNTLGAQLRLVGITFAGSGNFISFNGGAAGVSYPCCRLCVVLLLICRFQVVSANITNCTFVGLQPLYNTQISVYGPGITQVWS